MSSDQNVLFVGFLSMVLLWWFGFLPRKRKGRADPERTDTNSENGDESSGILKRPIPNIADPERTDAISETEAESAGILKGPLQMTKTRVLLGEREAISEPQRPVAARTRSATKISPDWHEQPFADTQPQSETPPRRSRRLQAQAEKSADGKAGAKGPQAASEEVTTPRRRWEVQLEKRLGTGNDIDINLLYTYLAKKH